MAINLQSLISKAKTDMEPTHNSEALSKEKKGSRTSVSVGRVASASERKDWSEAKNLAKTFGVNFLELQKFLQKKVKESVERLEFPTSEENTPNSPLSLASDFDIKSNEDTKHTLLDDSKQRIDSSKLLEISWDSKHRQLRFPGLVENFDFNLDNKHIKTDTKGSGSSQCGLECKSQEYSGLRSGARKNCDSPIIHVPSVPFEPSFGDTLGGLDIGINMLPENPDFGFSSEDEDDAASDNVTQDSAVFNSSSSSTSNYTKTLSTCERKELPRENKPYFGAGSILQVNARQSILNPEAIAKMKKTFYRKSLAAGWKRHREDNKSASGVQGAGKRARKEPFSVPVTELFSEELLKSFVNRIVSCPICRVPSHTEQGNNVRF